MSKSTAPKDKVTIIQAGQSERDYWRDLWSQRELLYFIAWRDLIVRYKQTIVGAAWVLIRPLLTLLIFSLIFGRWAGLDTGDVPYPILVFAGLVPWYFFSNGVSDCTSSVASNGGLVAKIYFPRIIIPFASILVSLVDYLVSFLLIIVVVLWTGVYPDWKIVFFPLLTLWVMMLALGFGLWGAALSVKYRDLRHLIPFLLQLGIYASPVAYAATIVPEKWRFLYSLNPMVGIINGFRWAILGKEFNIYDSGMALSMLFTILLLVSGILVFRKLEKTFVDYL